MENTINVLHLEDEEPIVRVVQDILQKDGLHINSIHVQTQSEFIAALENNNIDLVIADYSLPEYDGLSALRLLRKRDTATPFILFSGSISEEKAITSLREGATDYVLKEKINALVPVVTRALNEAKLAKEQAAAIEALHISEESYRITIKNIPLAILNLDASGLIVSINDCFTRMFGLSAESVVNKLKITSLEPFKEAGISTYFSNLIKKNEKFDFESPAIHTGADKKLYLRCRGIPNVDNNGKITSYLILLGNITERKQAEEALRESQQMLQLVLDTIPTRVFWKDCSLNYLGCNKAFAHDAGLSSPEEIIGKTDFDLGWKEQAEAYRADDRATIDNRQPKFNYEESQRTPTGEMD